MNRKLGIGASTLLALLLVGGAAQARGQDRELAPPVAFWRTLGDTTLERLAAEVVKSNHDVVAARARLRGARAARLDAALDFAPAVTATASYTRQRLSSVGFPGSVGSAFPDQNVWDAGLQLSWELDVFGRIRKSTQGRAALIGAAEEDVQDLQVLLTAELAVAYFDLRGAQDRLQVARRNAENQQHTLDVTLQRLEAGRGNEFDSERARAQLNSTLAGIPELEASIIAVEHRIAVLVGRPVSGLEQDSVQGPSVVALPDSILVPNADVIVRLRPDVRSAERQVAAGGAFVGAAKAAYLPRLTIGGGMGYVGNTFDALGNSSIRGHRDDGCRIQQVAESSRVSRGRCPCERASRGAGAPAVRRRRDRFPAGIGRRAHDARGTGSAVRRAHGGDEGVGAGLSRLGGSTPVGGRAHGIASHRATLTIVSHVRVVCSFPNVFSINPMNTGPLGVGR